MSYCSFIVCTFALNLASRLADHEDPGETKFSVRETWLDVCGKQQTSTCRLQSADQNGKLSPQASR